MSVRHRAMMPVLLAPAFMVIVDVFIVNVTAPLLRTDLGASDSAIQLVMVAYVLAFAISLITGGRLGDIFGRRRMFSLGVAGFTFASLVCAVASSIDVLIAGRILQGLGAAAMLPQMVSILQVEFPPEERHRAFAFQNLTQASASVSAQVIGGALLAVDPFGLSWRVVFLVNVPVGILVLLLSRRVIPESRSATATRLDLRGVALVSLVLGMILIPAIEGRELGWPPWIFVMMAAAIPVALIFVRDQRRLAASRGVPLVPPRLFARRQFRFSIAATVVIFVYFSYFLWYAIFLQEGLRLSALDSGLVYVPMASVSAVATVVVLKLPGRLQDRLPPIGAAITIVGFLVVAAVAQATDRITPWMVIATFPLGGGLGLMVPALNRYVLKSVPAEDAGSAAGLLTTSQQIGNAIGVAVIGSIFYEVLGRGGGPADYGAAFATACVVQAGVLVCGTAVLLFARTEPIPLTQARRLP
jgi:EmrB/QacA subfamily drug resistance transporter